MRGGEWLMVICWPLLLLIHLLVVRDLVNVKHLKHSERMCMQRRSVARVLSCFFVCSRWVKAYCSPTPAFTKKMSEPQQRRIQLLPLSASGAARVCLSESSCIVPIYKRSERPLSLPEGGVVPATNNSMTRIGR